MNVNCGVYAIINLRNGRIYVGASKRINRRFWAHVRSLNHGDHKNKQMQSDWNSMGSCVFTFTVLEFCSASRLDNIEIKWVQKIGTYNRIPGGRHNIHLVNQDPIVRKMRSDRARRQHASGSLRSYFNSETARSAQQLSSGNRRK